MWIIFANREILLTSHGIILTIARYVKFIFSMKIAVENQFFVK